MAPLSFSFRSRRLSPRRRFDLAGLAILASSLLLSCSTKPPGESGEAKPRSSLKGLRIEPAKIKSSPAFPGRKLRVFGSYTDGDDRELEATLVKFKSSDPAIAGVSTSGEVLFLQPGIATIVVTSEGVEETVPVEIRTPPIALAVSGVSPGGITIVVDKLRPGQHFRVFGTTDLEKGVTRVTDCLRLDLRLKGATPLAEVQLQGDNKTYTEATVPLPANEKALALQVVTSDCAISPVVVADLSTVGSQAE